MADLRLCNQGSIFILEADSDAGRDWIKEHIPADAIHWGKDGVIVEHRYIEEIVRGAISDGLEVE